MDEDKLTINNESSLEEDIKRVEESKKFLSWIQTFSKKIVSVTFLLYLLLNLIVVLTTLFQVKSGMITSFDTIYSEINETFRVVIGGYLIKAGIENACKIGGNYMVGISDAKLNMLKDKYKFESSNNIDKEDEFGDTTF